MNFMKRLSKILSLILAVIITASLFIVPVFSADAQADTYASLTEGTGCGTGTSSQKQ